MSKIRILRRNAVGIDYTIGDIHGCFETLEKTLEKIGFDRTKDRLICVGDLTDRGPQSYRATEFLDEPWFISIMGNHDAFVCKTAKIMLSGKFETRSSDVDTCVSNGGTWLLMQTDQTLTEIVNAFSQLPIAIEYQDLDGTVLAGLVHAELDHDHTWGDLKSMLEELPYDYVYSLDEDSPRAIDVAVWGRAKISTHSKRKLMGDHDDAWAASEGVPVLICGHNVVNQENDGPVRMANNRLIDHGMFRNQGEDAKIYRLDDLLA